ncbi:TPA: glycosyltransferase family 2 protein, partial [Streptococcus suis]
MDKISVIVPVYNVDKYLSSCIESIINQNYKNIEILLIDDGSVDDSAKICKEYAEKDKRVKIFFTNHSGVSNARNHGIKRSTAEYIMFVDSDDVVDSRLVEKLYFNIIKSRSDLSGCLYATFSENINNFEVNNPNIDFEAINTVQDMGEKNFMNLYINNIFSTPVCKLYKKRYITDLFQENQWLGEDLLFNLHYLKNIDRVSYLTEHLYFYRRGILSTVNSFKEGVFLQLENLQKQVIVLFKQIYGEDFDVSIVKDTIRWQVFYYSLLMFKYGKQSIFDKFLIFR